MALPELNAAKRQAEQGLQEAKPWLIRLARLGYGAKGVLYLIVGIFAIQAAALGGHQTTNTQGALGIILGEPFGRVLLGVMALGLLSHAVWRLVEAALDPEHSGTDMKGKLTRLGYAVSGLIYAGLAFTAAKLVIGASVNHGNWAEAGTARLLASSWGQWLVGALGVVIVGVGLYSLYAAYKAPFLKQMALGGLSETTRNAAIGLGRAGNAARGVVFGIIGVYLVQAALTVDPHRVRGIQGAQTSLVHQPGGPWLLGIVAVGLMAYGLFMFVEARFHRLGETESAPSRQ